MPPSEVLLLMGPPGAGKGTQAVKLARARKLHKISTGDMLRSHVGKGTDLGRKAKSIMEAGELVPDDLIIDMVRSELEAHKDSGVRVLLDGFPRTPEQASALDMLLQEYGAPLTAAVLLEVDEKELVNRLSQRALEENRSDDDAATVIERMRVYREKTQPLLDYYDERVKLRRVNGMGTVEDVFARITEVLP
ncbi:MAG TPA: adenylate kinase [Chloroflexota bacterium]|nr:adenylate kinase [Chloroflexota bacterium]